MNSIFYLCSFSSEKEMKSSFSYRMLKKIVWYIETATVFKNLAILPITLTVCRLLFVLSAFNATGAVQLLLNSAVFLFRVFLSFFAFVFNVSLYVSFSSVQLHSNFSFVHRLASRHNAKRKKRAHTRRSHTYTCTRAYTRRTHNFKWEKKKIIFHLL